jgi:hypothetical protein
MRMAKNIHEWLTLGFTFGIMSGVWVTLAFLILTRGN